MQTKRYTAYALRQGYHEYVPGNVLLMFGSIGIFGVSDYQENPQVSGAWHLGRDYSEYIRRECYAARNEQSVDNLRSYYEVQSPSDYLLLDTTPFQISYRIQLLRSF